MMSSHFGLALLVGIAVPLGNVCAQGCPPTSCQPAQAPRGKPRVDVPALIDKLANISEGDIGYSGSVGGSTFLPLDREGRIGVMILMQKPMVHSDTMEQLVRAGPAALPHLIEHLGDRRKTKIRIQAMGGGTFIVDDMDRNERIEPPPTRKETVEIPDGFLGFGIARPHTMTVGDLCFVAIGQIVNRQFDAAQYIPSGNVALSSPTDSRFLREQVRATWGSLTPEKHKASLIADFLKPDSEERRIGACQRLAFYYPDALEPVALKILAQPVYSFWGVQVFVDKLYRESDPAKRRTLFDTYIKENGEAYRTGVMLRLFKNLEDLEYSERDRSSPSNSSSDATRPLLIQLFGKPKNAESKDRPKYVDFMSDLEMGRLIEEGFLYDQNRKIDRAVRDVLSASKQDVSLAWKCAQRLAGRGYDGDIEAYCKRILPLATNEYYRDKLEDMLDNIGWTPLHTAVKRNDQDAVRALVRDKTKVDAACRNGTTPLHLAAEAGDIDIVRILVEAGATSGPKNQAGLLPVQLAMRRDNYPVVRFLVERGSAVPDAQVAVVAGKADLLERFLESGAEPLETKPPLEKTLLHLAAWSGDASTAQVLIKRGAKLDAKDWRGMSALHWAAMYGSDTVAKQLIQAGANIRAQVRKITGIEPLHTAAEYGQVKVAARLLEAGAAVDAKTKDKEVTPLHLAAALGHREMVDLLLKYKASLDAKNDFKRTPLHLAAAAGHARLVELLLRRGASVDAADEFGQTALHLAARGDHVETAEKLLQGKAAIDARDKQGQTPLHTAVDAGWPSITKFLLERRADPKTKDDQKRTPLDLARTTKEEEIRKILEAASGNR